MTSDTNNLWYSSCVFHGDKSGRQIGFPTINLDPTIMPLGCEEGVYASRVEVRGKKYTGALYFGPRSVKNEVFNVLEIYILDFTGEIYGETVQFSLGTFIRPVIHFTTLEELKQQLYQDIADIKKLENTYADKI
jgi:riboflavin kinase / FMN adenylyltransferase